MQIAVQQGKVYVLEVNPRASRTVPFVSKATNVALAKLGVLVMVGKTLAELRTLSAHSPLGLAHKVDPPALSFSTIKASVFPFNKFPGTDTLLGPEMRSTGEVMGIDASFHKALLKAFLGAGMRLPKRGTIFLSVKDTDKQALIPIARRLAGLGFNLLATVGTQKGLVEAGLKCERINKVAQGSPHIVELIEKRGVDMVINTTIGKQSIIDSFSIRERALRYGVPYFTVLATAREAAESLSAHVTGSLGVKPLQEYHGR